jgi:peptidoglycan-associated lipoprotein
MLLKKSAVAFLALLLLSGCNSTKKHSGMGHGTECSMLSEFEKNVGDKVHFAYNRSDLSSCAKEQLNKQACWLKKHCHVKATVEGHCDPRGTREYNLALGERRAEAVKHYLHSQGIESNRIDTISYGKERPAGHGHGEEAWAKDRRAVTKVK